MTAKVRFGSAGIPLSCKGESTVDGIGRCHELGLDAMEVEWVHGVNMKADSAILAGRLADNLDILLSCHAPYFTNCCSPDRVKAAIARHNLLESMKVGEALGSKIIVFHPGFYQDANPKEAMERCKEVLTKVLDEAESKRIFLGPETSGKQKAFGNVDEILELCSSLERTKPVIDFAHIHAYTNGGLKTGDDYRKLVFDKLEKELGSRAMNGLHCHFSGIEFAKASEKKHLPIETGDSPHFAPLAKVIVENGYAPTIICESPLLEHDALKMKDVFTKEKKGLEEER